MAKRCSHAPWVFAILIPSLVGCTTEWVVEGAYYRATQTLLAVESTPSGTIWINGHPKGQSPLSFPMEYEREIQRKTRKVSYWVSQPGLALGLSLLSLGLYVPFSVIPVDVELTQEPQATFRSNQFVVQVQAAGHQPWGNTVVCTGQDRVSLNPILVRSE